MIETFAGVQQVLKGADFVSAYDKCLFTTVEPILTKEIIVRFFTSSPGYHHRYLMYLNSKGIDQMKRVLMQWMKPKGSLTVVLPPFPSPYILVWILRPWPPVSRKKLKSCSKLIQARWQGCKICRHCQRCHQSYSRSLHLRRISRSH